MDEMTNNRMFMKCPDLSDDGTKSDQELKLPQPPLEKAAVGEIIELPAFENAVRTTAYTDLLDNRRSGRAYSDMPATGEQLAFMLWSVQGVQAIRGANRYASLRPVPSGGARHPFEVYAAVLNVEGLKPGIYHYLPLEHVGEKRVSVEFTAPLDNAGDTITDMLAGQSWAAKAPFTLFFSCLPYRGEWRYREMAHRVMLIDLGHAGQNAMLSAAALGLTSCCCAAYDAARCDEVLGLDGLHEYTVYAVTVGQESQKAAEN
ncbi:MAG: SagB/ThcOx family dehydrogenase [Oscillospiraceae bacterium]|jgi:SagB-type dehydrogenase family enzyme|nr:SagB/ThcOx family dehydrogenase [Oscillospiraceae bacterium]